MSVGNTGAEWNGSALTDALASVSSWVGSETKKRHNKLDKRTWEWEKTKYKTISILAPLTSFYKSYGADDADAWYGAGGARSTLHDDCLYAPSQMTICAFHWPLLFFQLATQIAFGRLAQRRREAKDSAACYDVRPQYPVKYCP